MLFKIKAGENVFETNPELKAIPEFEVLSDKQMKYVILTYDYKSPLRGLPLESRKEKAAALAGYNYEKDNNRLNVRAREMMAGKTRKVNAAIAQYKEIQFDDDRDLLDALNEYIGQIKELARRKDKSIDEMGKASRIIQGLDDHIKQRKEIAELLELREESFQAADEDIVEESELSTLDKFNQEL